ncbi:hypothetical protein MRB53_018343 [Persea americana]|uniref:Uncharacterized protein n=2 Tax=Persea americana TaxID=3435 RepID=A0ACC2M8J7_PERAE|nr:hypothetical protein MRB53_018340 [Persea americana]KAJ8641649.1 hypothetical protein MRB53_018343 [Persea americana]
MGPRPPPLRRDPSRITRIQWRLRRRSFDLANGKPTLTGFESGSDVVGRGFHWRLHSTDCERFGAKGLGAATERGMRGDGCLVEEKEEEDEGRWHKTNGRPDTLVYKAIKENNTCRKYKCLSKGPGQSFHVAEFDTHVNSHPYMTPPIRRSEGHIDHRQCKYANHRFSSRYLLPVRKKVDTFLSREAIGFKMLPVSHIGE